jgi:hypothetical protein
MVDSQIGLAKNLGGKGGRGGGEWNSYCEFDNLEGNIAIAVIEPSIA